LIGVLPKDANTAVETVDFKAGEKLLFLKEQNPDRDMDEENIRDHDHCYTLKRATRKRSAHID
jgi:hypothetical protein